MERLNNAYALLIGVKDDKLDTLIDAKGIYDMLVDENLSAYHPDNIIFLSGEETTRKHILDAFDKLQQMTNEDSSVFLYYTGHGGYGLGEYFIQPYGIVGSPAEAVRNSWVSASELKEKLNGLKSKRLIFFLDCCHAEGMTKGGFFNQKEEIKSKSGITLSAKSSEVADGLGQKIDNERGVSIISSCREDQLSYQPTGQNSIFTKCLIDAVQGKNKSEFKDPFIRIYEVLSYLQEEVPKIAMQGGKAQNPYVNLQLYDNFVLSYVPKEIRKKLSIQTSEKSEDKSSKELKEVVTSYRETESSNNLLLFVHGFSGEAADTFGIIPELLMKDERMNGWDMKPMGYSPNVDPEFGKDIWGGIKDIDKISKYLAKSFRYKFDKYDRIAIVAHSLGGLIAQKAIINSNEELRSKISHLILLGTPNYGIEAAQLTKLWNNKYKELSSTGDFIVSLRNEWDSIFKNKYPFKLKVAAAIDDEYVDIASSFGSFPKEYCEIVAGNHSSMVKPKDEFNDSYNLIVNTLTNNTFYNQYTNSEEINIALGKYDAVIKKLLPNANALDINGLRQLVFSLEGADRKDEALELITNHSLAKDNGDLFGIIGGRYKRSYLLNHKIEDAQQAIDYYMKGLTVALKDNNLSQIYYQAINLAFLSIVAKNNETEMLKYANQALEAANACRNNLWKYATIAEANLYLDNMDVAKEYYTKAAEMSGIREKISMHTNAYKAYTCLMDTDNPNDDFIKFLHTSFLS
ncbi:caspase family protein [Lutibacter maritimus]|uniref:Putative serine esterase n=1 Tax=Lutibacter maritimus TaxID=593133 RepID=A0A1I6P0S1_9FLAO|nr:caspase family protein [Lutibacter maritimus]SFS33816.1 Putative serine esterase [Lutibacter maritimus]